MEGGSGALTTPGKDLREPYGAKGGARGGLGGPDSWDCIAGCPNADWPGLGGLVGGWARLTRSSPDESDSLSEFGGHSMMPELVVPTSFLLQESKFL